MVRGYVKPLFRDMKVYDPQQDKKKGFFREVYEGLVGVVTKLLENKRDEGGDGRGVERSDRETRFRTRFR
jgi:hypothetical protein